MTSSKPRSASTPGEIERPRNGSPRGTAVHLGARIAAAAGPDDVLVSANTQDLVAGSGLEFEDRGEVELTDAGTRRVHTFRG